MRWAHPGPQGIISIIIRTVLTLDLGLNYPFHPLALPPPLAIEPDFMDIDVPEDLQSSASEGGPISERRSSTEEILPYSPSTEMEVDSSDDEDTTMEDTEEDEEEVEAKEDSSELILTSSIKTEEEEDPLEDEGGEEWP